MVVLKADELRGRDRHHLMTSTIVPRPIAWVMSRSGEGRLNLAPFSFFNGVSAKPPLISISVSARRGGELKDTRRNLEQTKEFVVHVVDEPHAHQMVETSGVYPPDTSEVDLVGLKTVPCEIVGVPRLADAGVAMECRLVDVYEPPGGAVGLLIGEILAWHVREGLLVHKEGEPPRVDVHKLRPLARLGGTEYAPVREVFHMETPT
jgi:flavin reductase (DIM6/NTAB) family NADH-FMN oxidoreductase RutF